MFKKNTKHLQPGIFGFFNTLPEQMTKKIEKSEEYTFYKLIFCNIDENIFKDLYSDKKSRPNAPINAMVASLILMNRYNWTYEELFKHISFNILTKIALGLDSLEEIPFCTATLFNFQNKLNDHFIKTGENLLEQIFDKLTEKQLKTLKIKTSIQRTDSFAAASNIRNYSRLQLLVELILRIYRILSNKDKERFIEEFKPYINKESSGQYIYSLQVSDIPHELEKIGKLYYWIEKHVKPLYKSHNIFKIFERVYSEHFSVIKDKVKIKSNEELTSDCVQSPDDLDATYRKKNNKVTKGQSVNIVETAHPDNSVNLITDVSINPVNKDDSKVLHERLDKLKEKTPELEELHFDGAYGSEENDKKLEKYNITPVQTGVRGKKASVEIEVEQKSDTEYIVHCPLQDVTSMPTRKRHKAIFDYTICKKCPLRNDCPTIKRKSYRVFYFDHAYYLSNKREKMVESIPVNRRKIRNNVEATVKEFVHKMPNRKVKVRGAFKTAVFVFIFALSVNFGRIYRLNPG